MADRDTVDFVTAFAVGAILGVGATLLLRSEPPTARERVVKELKPYGKRIRKGARRAWREMGSGAGSAMGAGEDLASAGRAVLSDFRDEIADIVSGARSELSRAMEHQVRDAQRALRKSARRLRH